MPDTDMQNPVISHFYDETSQKVSYSLQRESRAIDGNEPAPEEGSVRLSPVGTSSGRGPSRGEAGVVRMQSAIRGKGSLNEIFDERKPLVVTFV